MKRFLSQDVDASPWIVIPGLICIAVFWMFTQLDVKRDSPKAPPKRVQRFDMGLWERR